MLAQDLKEKKEVIDLQKGEIIQLRNKVESLELEQVSQPSSGVKLPPVKSK